MPLFDLDKLDRLQGLEQLNRLEQLNQLEKLDKLDKLDNLQQLSQMQQLDRLQYIEQLSQLQQLNQLQHLDKLQNLDKLANLQALDKLQQLDVLNNMQYLQNLYHVDHLQQLQLLTRMDKLERLSQLNHLTSLNKLDRLQQMQNLSELKELPELTNLEHMQNLQQLSSLDQLNQLEVLNRLRILNRFLAFDVNPFLYLFSLVAPGLIFQEVIALTRKKNIEFKRALVLAVVYNILNFVVCSMWVFQYLGTQQATQNPILYYILWIGILILAPGLLGGLIGILAGKPKLDRFSTWLSPTSPGSESLWKHLMGEAGAYQIIITLTNNEKLRGIVHREQGELRDIEPNGLYFTEISHYDPQQVSWEELEQPMDVWVRESEIKMLEVSPEMK